MIAWLNALRKETVPAVISAASLLSTIATFIFPSLAGNLRLVTFLSLLIGFAWANFRVFEKQSQAITALESKLREATRDESREARLVIHPGDKSYYVLAHSGPMLKGDFVGILLDLELSVENKGLRHSTINEYSVRLPILDREIKQLKPYKDDIVYGRNSAARSLQPQFALPEGDYIRVPPEDVTRRAWLRLMLAGMPPQDAEERGFIEDPGTRKYPRLTCILTLTDTEGRTATHEFVLPELP